MSIFSKIISALTPKSCAETEFGMEDMQFFIALLRACPTGSRLYLDEGESESFVDTFRAWSHRDQQDRFEANYYTVNNEFIAKAEQLAARGELELYHHFWIHAPDGQRLCSSLDDFVVVRLADDIREKIKKQANA